VDGRKRVLELVREPGGHLSQIRQILLTPISLVGLLLFVPLYVFGFIAVAPLGLLGIVFARRRRASAKSQLRQVTIE
jgi:hypothetical protein